MFDERLVVIVDLDCDWAAASRIGGNIAAGGGAVKLKSIGWYFCRRAKWLTLPGDMDDAPASLEIYRTAIEMRTFEHVAARRDVAEAVVVRLSLADGRQGWGETLPRRYVTGETFDTVIEDLAEVLWPAYCRGRRPPFDETHDGRVVNAAACALELAHLDATDGFTGQGAAGMKKLAARVSGVLGSSDPARTARQLRWMRRFGLRDFKLKLGFDREVDRTNLRVVSAVLGRSLKAGRGTLRVDVNGGWDSDSTPARVAELAALGVCAVEQPVFCSSGELAELAGRCELPLMADESLLSEADAHRLLAGPRLAWWNIRIAKNGGYGRALRLARLAAAAGVVFTVGCMVGESGLLSAAQRRLLQVCPPPRFVEGNYGKFLLRGDLVRSSLHFGYGGRLKALTGTGLGVAANRRLIDRYGQLVCRLGPRTA